MLLSIETTQVPTLPNAVSGPIGGAAAQTAEPTSTEPAILKVLIVDEDIDGIDLVEHCLRHAVRWEPQIVTAATPGAARFAVEADTFDVALVDAESAGAFLPRWTSRPASGPCIVIGSLMTSETEAEAIALGAAACVAREDITPKILETIVNQAIRTEAMQRTLAVLSRALSADAATVQERSERAGEARIATEWHHGAA